MGQTFMAEFRLLIKLQADLITSLYPENML
jgi:hypothetical protein